MLGRVCCIVLGLVLGGLVHAGEHRFDLLFDTDANAATGCSVAEPTGAIAGIEQKFSVYVVTTTTSASISRSTRQVCTSGTLGAESVVDATGWPVGLGVGVGGVAVIETYVPRNLLPTTGTMRVTTASSTLAGGDVVAPFTLVLEDTPEPEVVAIPVPLARWLLAPLALLLALGALHWHRRHPQQLPPFAIVILFCASTLVWAATAIIDGNTGDWTGVAASSTDPKGDAPIDADIVAVYVQRDEGRFYFRIDADVRLDSAANRAPVVNAGSDQTITLPATATLAGTATDDGLPAPAALTTSWSAVSGPASGVVLFADASQRNTTVRFTTPGSYTLRLTADDGALTGSDEVTIVVADSGPKLAAVADRTISLGTHFRLQLVASDANVGDQLSFALVSGPTGASLNPSPTVDWTPTVQQLGTHLFNVSAHDAFGHADSGSFRITVVAANRAPKLDPQADASVPRGATFARTVSATDPDLQPLVFALTTASAGMSLTGAVLTWPTGTTAPGDYPVTVMVTDSGGLFDAQRFVVTVTPSAPPVANDDHYEVQLGQTLTVPAPGVLGNDIDPMGGSLTAARLTDPGKGTLNAFNADGSFSYVAPLVAPGPAFQPVLKWNNAAPYMGGSGNSLVADVFGNGHPVVFTIRASINSYGIVAVDGTTGATLWQINNVLPGPNAKCYFHDTNPNNAASSSLAVGDIDDSGVPAIVAIARCDADNSIAGSIVNRMVALNARTGEFKWLTAPLGAPHPAIDGGGYFEMTYNVTPTIARLHPGETPSVLFKRNTQGWLDNAHALPACDQFKANSGMYFCTGVIALNGADGSVRQRFIAPGDGLGINNENSHGHVIVADLSGSGAPPHVIANGAVWDADGNLLSNRLGAFINSIALAKLDDSGQISIITSEGTGGADAYIVAHHADGSVQWQSPIYVNGGISGHLSVADLDGDGSPEIMTTVEGYLFVYDAKGGIKWIHHYVDQNNFRSIEVGKRPAAFDLDGDGIAEVIVPTSMGLEFTDGATGKTKASVAWPDLGVNNAASLPWVPGYRASAVVADIDGSGHASIVVSLPSYYYGSNHYVLAVRAQNNDWRPAPGVFNQFSYHFSNVDDAGRIPAVEANNFAVPRTNVFGNQPQLLTPVDPRVVTSTTFQYTAGNGTLNSAPATVTLALLPDNQPPVFTSTPPTRYLPPNGMTYAAHAVDPDAGDSVHYSMLMAVGNGVGGCSVHATTGLLTCSNLWAGEQRIVLVATDSQGAAAYQTLDLLPSAGVAPVPGVVGQSQATAEATLASAGFALGKLSAIYHFAPENQVLTQYPAAGASVLKGEAIALQLSLGPQPVPVPLVVGQALTSANTALTGSGFAVVVNRVFSNVDPINAVLAQSVAAGMLLAPTAAHPVTLTVSAGNGLRVTVNRSIATAEQTVTVSTAAFDAEGNPATLPALTYAIAPVLTPYAGPLPTLAGLDITAGAATQGAFRVTATDTANGRHASADFVVLPPPAPGGVTHGQAYAQMATALDAIFALKQPLIAARDANDLPQMTVLLQQMVTLWRGVDIDDLKLSMPLVTADQFAPSLADLGALGLSATADDVVIQQVLRDAADDLRAWTDALKAPGTSIIELNALADQFSTRAARLDGLIVSEYGGIYNQRQYTRLLSHRIPAFYEALFEELAAATGMPPRTPEFPGLKRRPLLKSTLAEQLTTIAVNYVVEKIMDDASSVYKNAKQFAVDTMKQAAWTAAAVGIAAHLKETVLGGDVVEVISGASLSFRVFNDPVLNQAIVEVPGDFEDAELTSVMIIGPDTVADTVNGVKDLFQKMKDGFSYGLDPKNNPKRFKNFNEVKKYLKEMKAKLLAIKKSVTGVQDTIDNAYQAADDVLPGCIFTSDSTCAQLIYNDGIKPVYRYTAPDGLQSLGGLPVPIIFIVQNQYTGLMYFGTPAFMPAPKKTP